VVGGFSVVKPERKIGDGVIIPCICLRIFAAVGKFREKDMRVEDIHALENCAIVGQTETGEEEKSRHEIFSEKKKQGRYL
jgi:hypothetical protein